MVVVVVACFDCLNGLMSHVGNIVAAADAKHSSVTPPNGKMPPCG